MTVTLAVGEWVPYTSCSNSDCKIAEHIVKEAFKLEGIDVEIVYYPWKRCYEMTKSGECDGTFPWYSNDERETLFYVNRENLLTSKEVFFHRKDLDFEWESLDDLKNYNIGGTLGYSHVDFLEKNGIAVDIVNDDITNFKKVLGERIQIFPADYIVGEHLIKTNFNAQEANTLTYNPKALSGEKSMRLLVSRTIPDGKNLATKFDNGLKELKSSGRYQQILNSVNE